MAAFLIVPRPAFAGEDYWHLLLHDQQNIFGTWKSEAHNPEFFLAPQGRTDPTAELKADLAAVKDQRLLTGQPFACVFPARYQYLKSIYKLSPADPPCPRLKAWKEQFAAESATMVFATSYLSNVASIFGHAFLKINAKKGFNSRGELLDLGISFSAKDDPNDNPVLFAWKGLTGGYLEEYSVMAYFTRLSEYHGIENRDVWEYKLKLTPEQVDRLLDHVWELRSAQIDYYFTNRNCAYHLWTLLQIANADWNLTVPAPAIAIPVDGIKSLVRLDAVSQVKFRPSIYHKLKQKILAMSAAEKNDFEKARHADLAITGHESSLVLESLLDYQQFTLRPFGRDLLPNERTKQDEIFARLTAAAISDSGVPGISESSQPDLGQGGKKVSFILGSGQSDNYAELEFRPTLHDLLDDDEGYTAFSQIEAARTRFHFSESQHSFYLQELDLIDIISLTPVDSLQTAPSWLIQAGTAVPPDTVCPSCLSAIAQGGAGLSAYLMPRTENAVVFAFFKMNLDSGAGTPGSFRFGPSELLGLDSRLSKSLKFLSEVEFRQYLDGHFNFEQGDYFILTLGLAWNVARNFELRWNALGLRLPSENAVVGNLSTGFYF